MKHLILVLFSMVLPLVTGSSAFSQTDLFAISGDQVIAKAQFFTLTKMNESNSVPAGVKVYEHNAGTEKAGNYSYSILGVNCDEPSFTYGDPFEGIRIYTTTGHKLLLERWGHSPLRDISWITMNPSTKKQYLAVPLDNETTAFFFGGTIFDGDKDAPELMIAVAHKNQAKVVYDGRALVYSYTPSPQFSIEFVETMNWKQNEYGNDETPTAEPLSSRIKHKIWKEGNMLKYKQWK